MKVFAIDARWGDGLVGAAAGPASWWLAYGYVRVEMTSVQNMVQRTLWATSGLGITELHIVDHGTADGIEVGDDWLDTTTIEAFRPQLSRLKGKFAEGGLVYLHNCNAGKNEPLMKKLAGIVGVPVYAGTGLSVSIIVNLGKEVECNAATCWNP